MRVLVMLGWAGGYGGVENVVGEFTKFMTDKGHEIVITLDKTGIQSTKWLDGFNWLIVDLGMERGGKLWKLRRINTCVQVLQKVQPDIVLVDIPYWIPYVQLARKLMFGRQKKPVLASWIHTHIGGGDRYLMKWLSSADCHLALSAIQAETLNTITPKEQIRIVHNPVVLPNAVTERSDTSEPHLLFIGRLAPEKRVDLILKAMARLKDTTWTASIVGDGPLRDELLNLERELSIPPGRVSWFGWRDEPWRTVEDATVLVLPSSQEGFPLVVVEAWARGIAVITSDGQTLWKEFLSTGQGGWQFKMGSSEELAGILKGISDGDVSFPDTSKLRKLATPFGLTEWGTNFERCLVELVGSSAPGGKNLLLQGWGRSRQA